MEDKGFAKDFKEKRKTVTRKTRKAGIIAILFFLAGILFISFPFLKEYLEDQKQQMILTEYEKRLRDLPNEENIYKNESKDLKPELRLEAENSTKDIDKDGLDTVGILQIDAIDLKQPILKDATKEHLDLTISTIEPTIHPGEEGNFVVAGHHSRTYGRHFNRLEELDTGDSIVVETLEGIYTYRVTECSVIKPSQTEVLLSKEGQNEITLITCYYPGKGETERFMVKGNEVKDERK